MYPIRDTKMVDYEQNCAVVCPETRQSSVAGRQHGSSDLQSIPLPDSHLEYRLWCPEL